MRCTGSFRCATGVHTDRAADKHPCSRASLSGTRLDIAGFMNTDSNVCDQNSRTNTLYSHCVYAWYPRGKVNNKYSGRGEGGRGGHNCPPPMKIFL